MEHQFAITCSEGERRASDRECHSRAVLASPDMLRDVHFQLCLVHPTLENSFPFSPTRSKSPGGFFGSLSRRRDYADEFLDDDAICAALETYFQRALDVSGRRLLFSLLFGEEDYLTDYEEDIQELRLRAVERTLARTENDLREVLVLRDRAETMLELSTVYAVEDEVVTNVSLALAELYNFQLGPFLELREAAAERMQALNARASDQSLGERVRGAARAGAREWESRGQAASEAVQQLYQDYYRHTVALVSGQRDRMLEDQKQFGRSTFELRALSRLQRLEVFVCQERLKLLGAVRAMRELQLDKIVKVRKETASSCGKGKPESDKLSELDNEVSETQLSIYDIRLEILQEEERLLQRQKEILDRAWQEEVDEGIFYDAVEDADQVEDDVEGESSVNLSKADKLKMRLSRIYRKRAVLRNKRKTCVAEQQQRKMKQKEKQKGQQKQQAKRQEQSKQRDLDPEWISAERRKTLQRLREYKQKFQNGEDDDVDIMASPSEDSAPRRPSRKSSASLKTAKNKAVIALQKTDTVEKDSLADADSLPPPPPPPPPLPPPPPPPPPPFPADLRTSTLPQPSVPKQLNNRLNGEGNPKVTERKPVRNGGPGLDFGELLAARSKLRKAPQVTEEDRPNGRDGSSDFSKLLSATLKKIHMANHSPEESEHSNDEFE